MDVDIDGAREVFLIFDKQGDQKIDVSELGSVLRALNRTPLESEVCVNEKRACKLFRLPH